MNVFKVENHRLNFFFINKDSFQSFFFGHLRPLVTIFILIPAKLGDFELSFTSDEF